MLMFSDEAAACVELQSSWRRSQQSLQHQSVRSSLLLAAIPHRSFKEEMKSVLMTETHLKGFLKRFCKTKVFRMFVEIKQLIG